MLRLVNESFVSKTNTSNGSEAAAQQIRQHRATHTIQFNVDICAHRNIILSAAVADKKVHR